MRKSSPQILRILLLIGLDILLITASDGFALLLRFDFSYSRIPRHYITAMSSCLIVQLIITIAMFLLLNMYRYLWRTVSSRDAINMILSVIAAYCVVVLVCFLAGLRLPISVVFLSLMCQIPLLVGMRCSLRLIDLAYSIVRARSRETEEHIMLIGGGSAGRILARELSGSKKSFGKVCCVIDDNPALWGRRLDGIPVVGGRESIQKEVNARKITQIIFAIPTAKAEDKRAILELCQKTDCKVRTLPGIYQLVNGEVSLSSLHDVRIEDLLGRDPVDLDLSRLAGFLQGKVVLVTGGGGSIGSELCRQIAFHHPARLIIVDIYENNAYSIQQELQRRLGDALPLTVEIASIRDKARMYSIFDCYRPEVVFHAAAHKHVPLMEECPSEAIKNNIFGTYHVVRAAERAGVGNFVMISTDKAVNPTNFMGATKRFCEMILQSRISERSKTVFCAVRFGNVLGSNGSVIPLFQQQIKEGGPVTITDRRIIRYFMTIPEAAQLVLEAGAMAQPGQIFVLDMGEPVKILTLAENLIRLSGYRPYEDIPIKEIGLRPGEKLYEELLIDSNTLTKTDNRKIFVEQQESLERSQITEALARFDWAVTHDIPREQMIEMMKNVVPTYRSPEEVNREKYCQAAAG